MARRPAGPLASRSACAACRRERAGAGAVRGRHAGGGRRGAGAVLEAVGLGEVLRNGTISPASRTDDTPLDFVDLGFFAPVFGQSMAHAWINPNGGIQFTPRLPCGCCFIGSRSPEDACNFNTSYGFMLAAAVTDYLPQDGGTIRYGRLPGGGGFGITFHNIPVIPPVAPAPGPKMTFGANLRSSGHFSVAYQLIRDPGASPPQGQILPSACAREFSRWAAATCGIMSQFPAYSSPFQTQWATSFPARTLLAVPSRMATSSSFVLRRLPCASSPGLL